MPDQDQDGVRFFVRAADTAVPGIRAVPGWTVIQVLPDPARPGTSLVEVEDPEAPAEAAGLICEPTFTHTRRGPELDEHGNPVPFETRVSDYGIPA